MLDLDHFMPDGSEGDGDKLRVSRQVIGLLREYLKTNDITAFKSAYIAMSMVMESEDMRERRADLDIKVPTHTYDPEKMVDISGMESQIAGVGTIKERTMENDRNSMPINQLKIKI